MAESLAHRGPDGEGFFADRECALGHRRLSIIDVTGGVQPMGFSQLTLVFNGEIYNHAELRMRLVALGRHFKTHSDTEVILQAYDQWGEDCVLHFNGMWAFALWDGARKKLFCSRDRLGEKPFHFAEHDKTFVFGSEIKALAAFGVPLRLRADLLDVYLCLTYIPAPHTFFHGVRKLEPGSNLVVEGGKLKTYRYWTMPVVPIAEQRLDAPEVEREFEALFRSSVSMRMMSDVPFGAFLSGGLDSASVVSAMHAATAQQIMTFTIGFAERDYDERQLAREVADRFGTHHQEFEVGPANLQEAMAKLAWHHDEPFGDSSSLPTYLVSGLARQQVKMVLTGDGGDEVLGGYTIHQGERFAAQWQRLVPASLRSGLPLLVRGLTHLPLSRWQDKLVRTERVLRTANQDSVQRLAEKQNGFHEQERRKLLSGTHPAGALVSPMDIISDAIAPASGSDALGKLNHWLRTVSLPDDMLCKVDRASMAQSLETRVPFLDHRLVELMAGVSMELQLKGYTRKVILRRTMGVTLPPSLLSARKQGFVVPLRKWQRSTDSATLDALLGNPALAEHVRPAAVRQITEAHRTGLRDAGNAMWALSMLSLALQRYPVI